MTNNASKAKVIVISGPTAVGKSRVALALAHKLDGEIVSADSVQVYRGLDVGSAKTLPCEREGVPHHLIDIVEPTVEYSTGDFYDDARRATDLVISNRHVPIVVGGTGLYLRWYLNGKPGTPKETPDLTALVESEVAGLQRSGDWDAALQLLHKAGDALTPQALCRNDWYRLRRALAIVKATGLPRSQFPLSDPEASGGEPDFEFLCYFLYKRRLELYRGIDARCEEMLAAGKARPPNSHAWLIGTGNSETETGGFLAEASSLLDLGIRPGSSSASRAIGYRQAMDYLADCRSAGGTTSHEHFMKFLSSFQQASRNYAKRQLTWFRGEPLFKWVDAARPLEELVQFIVDDYHSPGVNSPVLLPPQSMSKREHALMNEYQARNRIFVNPAATASIVDWVARTQKRF